MLAFAAELLEGLEQRLDLAVLERAWKAFEGPFDVSAFADLDAQDDPRCKIVTCHHPLMEGPPGSPNPTISGDAAFLALARAGADAVLSGHVHDPFDQVVEVEGQAIRLVGAGTLSQRLRRSRPSFNRLELDRAGGFAVAVQTL